MLRSVTLSLALSVATAGCAAFIEPPPPGTVALPARFENRSGLEIDVSVEGNTGVPVAVRPTSSVPAYSTVTLTFYVPARGFGLIDIKGFEVIRTDRLLAEGPCAQLVVTIEVDLSEARRCEP